MLYNKKPSFSRSKSHNGTLDRYFLFDFINTEGHFVRYRLVLVKVQN